MPARHVQHVTALTPRFCDVPPCTTTLWEENGTTELEMSPERDLR